LVWCCAGGRYSDDDVSRRVLDGGEWLVAAAVLRDERLLAIHLLVAGDWAGGVVLFGLRYSSVYRRIQAEGVSELALYSIRWAYNGNGDGNDDGMVRWAACGDIWNAWLVYFRPSGIVTERAETRRRRVIPATNSDDISGMEVT
jgi:hypothetical protein